MLNSNTKQDVNRFLLDNLILQFLLILNYAFHLISANLFIITLNFLFIIFFFLKNLINDFYSRILFSKILLILLAIIALGSPLISWDAKTIWLFHAKRIFYENSIYAQLDNYANFSHNDYPVIVATLSASLAKILGHWNYVFPKFSNIFFILSPFLFLSFILRNKIKEIIFCFVILFILHKRLIIGEMDGLLALYFTLLLINIGLIVKSKKIKVINKINFKVKYLYSYLALNVIIFSLLKVEALGGVLIIISSLILINFLFKLEIFNIYKILTTALISLVPLIHWKYQVYQNSVSEYLTTIFNFKILLEQITNFSLYFRVINLFLFNTHTIMSIIFLTYATKHMFMYNSKKIEITYKNFHQLNFMPTLIFLSCFFYYLVIFLATLSSPEVYQMFIVEGKNDYRYNLPLSFAIIYAVIIFNKKNYIRSKV